MRTRAAASSPTTGPGSSSAIRSCAWQRARVHPHDGAGDRRRARRRGLEAGTKLGHKHVGVWVGERKIASVGVHISHGVSSHGFAVNVENDLDPFSWVVACGLPEVQMTSLQAEGVAEGLACFRKRAASLLRGVRAPPAARQRRAARHRAAGRGVMDVGLAIFLAGDGIRPGRAGPRAEARGYESLMVTEHTHIPVSAGMVARAAARSTRSTGTRTTRSWRSRSPPRRPSKLMIGTSVCLVIEHDPIVLAKQIASLQNLSGGRFVFGVGAGWNKRRCATTAPNPRRATATCASASRR